MGNDFLSFYKFFQYYLKFNKIQLTVRPFHKEVCDTLQNVCLGFTKEKIVIINISPRTGKTRLLEALACWTYAYFSDSHIINASYADDLATASTRSVLETLKSEWFQTLFGDVTGTIQQADHFKTKYGGVMKGAGLSGKLTGFGAGLKRPSHGGCFTGDTLVKTINGDKRIDSISAGDYVLSYNHSNKKCEWKKVLATRELVKNEIITIKTRSGSKIKATPCHRVFDGKSYIELSKLKRGDSLYKFFCEVPKLHNNIFKRIRRIEETNIKKKFWYFLLQKMFEFISFKKQNTEKIERDKLFKLHDFIQTSKPPYRNMLKKMFRVIALKKDERSREPKLQRNKQTENECFFQEKDEKTCNRKRWWVLCCLWKFIKSSLCSPYRSQQWKSLFKKSNNTLLKLPLHTSQISQDTIYSIKKNSNGKTKVYDIQVEENNNFFAEGILVHNCLLIDDAQKPAEAHSQASCKYVQQWFTQVMTSRRNSPNTPILICAQRISEEDLCGYVLSKFPNDVIHLKYPAMVDGVSTIEDTISTQDLLNLERVDPFTFYSQYMQSPIILGGNLIKTDWFRYYDDENLEFEYKILSADTALKVKEHNDYSVISVWGIIGKNAYQEEIIRGKFEAYDLETIAIQAYLKHQPRTFLIEDKASGSGLIQTLINKGIPVQAVQVNKDKLTRVMDVIPFIAVGNVFLKRGADYVPAFLSECAGFKGDMTHKNDDQIDAMSQLLSHLYRSEVSILDCL